MKTPKIIIVSGAIDAGKTTKIKSLIESYELSDKELSGFYSEKVFQSNELIGYDLVFLVLQKTVPFLRLKPFDTMGVDDRIGDYYINKTAISSAATEISNTHSIIFMDEIGRLELRNAGFAALLTDLLKNFEGTLILAVRDAFLDEVCKKWDIKNPEIIRLKKAI